MYPDIVDDSSLRCISVDFESDRYNFALFCTVKLRYSFAEFKKKIKPHLDTKEAMELSCIKTDEIPQILVNYRTETERAKYHPSTYLRLLMFLMHKYGYTGAERKLKEADRTANEKKLQ